MNFLEEDFGSAQGFDELRYSQCSSTVLKFGILLGLDMSPAFSSSGLASNGFFASLMA